MGTSWGGLTPARPPPLRGLAQSPICIIITLASLSVAIVTGGRHDIMAHCTHQLFLQLGGVVWRGARWPHTKISARASDVCCCNGCLVYRRGAPPPPSLFYSWSDRTPRQHRAASSSSEQVQHHISSYASLASSVTHSLMLPVDVMSTTRCSSSSIIRRRKAIISR